MSSTTGCGLRALPRRSRLTSMRVAARGNVGPGNGGGRRRARSYSNEEWAQSRDAADAAGGAMVPVRIETRAQLISLLTEAAELEHEILCCYLFACFSLKDDVAEGVTGEQLER